MTMHYQRNYLNSVIFHINYNIESLKLDIHEEISALCTEITGTQKIIQSAFNISFSNIATQNSATERVNIYSYKGQRFVIEIQNTSISLIDNNYTNHTEFHNKIISLFDMFNRRYANPVYTRVALRYVNNVTFPTGDTYDFNNLIDNALLASTLKYKHKNLIRSLGVINIKDDDDVVTTFTYGYVNVTFPNKISKREFVLDYDCSISTPSPISDIKPIIENMRGKVNSLFEESICQGLRDTMNQQ